MVAENKKSDAEEILSEFNKSHGIPDSEPEPEAPSEPEGQSTNGTRNVIFIGTKTIMDYVTATLTQLASVPVVTIIARGKRITQAIDVSQMIVKRMNEVGFKITDVRVVSDSLKSKDGQTRSVSVIQIDIQNMLDK